MNLVFMYGTLKRGQPNHYVLSERGSGKFKFIGKGQTSTKWPLVISSEQNIPYLLDKEGNGHNIKGEVYAVDDDVMSHLDQFECYPKIYSRRKVEIVMATMEGGGKTGSTNISITESNDGAGQGIGTMECWIYYLPRPFSPALDELETMDDYDSNGLHGKPYTTIYKPGEGWVEELKIPSS